MKLDPKLKKRVKIAVTESQNVIISDRSAKLLQYSNDGVAKV